MDEKSTLKLFELGLTLSPLIMISKNHDRLYFDDLNSIYFIIFFRGGWNIP
jgi:hypothetical protein